MLLEDQILAKVREIGAALKSREAANNLLNEIMHSDRWRELSKEDLLSAMGKASSWERTVQRLQQELSLLSLQFAE